MSVIIVCGVSLGACNTPVVAKALAGHRLVNYAFGFQASIYGAGRESQEVVNVQFAHLVRSDNPLPLPGLGAQHWSAGPGVKLIEDTVNDPHPGDGNAASQDKFLADIKQLQRDYPGQRAYLWGMYGQFGAAADPYNFINFLRRVAAEGIHVSHSPYRDYQTQTIVDEIMGVK